MCGKKEKIRVLVDALLSGNRGALAKLITIVENDDDAKSDVLNLIYPHTGRAYVVGVTGSPGSGKSTLVNEMTKEMRRRGKTVGIIGIDPTSAFTGGAILGDRIRMQEICTDRGVFMRSIATRGAVGGLSKSAHDVIALIDASGKDYIFVETVGAGQAEIDIIEVAHTSIVVLNPGMGDEIQAIKAGILEIADIFVLNKADMEDVDRAEMELKMMLDYSEDNPRWRPPIIRTVATRSWGIDELVNTIERHREITRERRWMEEMTRRRVLNIVRDKLMGEVEKKAACEKFEEIVKRVMRRELDPYSAADEFLSYIASEKNLLIFGRNEGT